MKNSTPLHLLWPGIGGAPPPRTPPSKSIPARNNPERARISRCVPVCVLAGIKLSITQRIVRFL
jgi:hypothetical protein